MAVWYGSLLLESDFAHETVSLYNCRELLSAFLSAPFESQISKQAMLDVIRKLWPSLLAEPINPNYSKIDPKELKRFSAYAPTIRAHYFGSILHSELLKLVGRRIVDRRVLDLIKKWLESPVVKTDDRRRKTRTTAALYRITNVMRTIAARIKKGIRI